MLTLKASGRNIDPEDREHFIASAFLALNHSSHLWGPLAAIALQLLVSALLLVVTFTKIFVDGWASSSNSIHLVYVTLLTVLATIVTSFTTGSIRKLWFHHAAFLSKDRSSAIESSIISLAGLGSLGDTFKSWRVSVSFVIVGLVTTSIVAGLTPRTITHVTSSRFGSLTTQMGAYCINSLGDRSISGSWFSWTLTNGTIWAYDQNPGPDLRVCEAGSTLDWLVNAIPNGRPKEVAYIMGDTQVHQGAAAVPWDSNGLENIFGTTRDTNFLWASRCLPVLKTNPVHCYAGGELQNTSDQLILSNGPCSVGAVFSGFDPTRNFTAVKGACTKGHKVGTATILLGATDGDENVDRFGVPNGFFAGYADLLSQLLQNIGLSPDQRNFAAICEVDLTTAVDFRLLNYSRAENFGKRQAIGYESETVVNSGYGYEVRPMSNSSCQMQDLIGNPLSLSDILTDSALATAGGAAWPLLAENMFSDGWYDTLYYVGSQLAKQNASQGDGTFADSKNALEDALGLSTAITLGLFWGGNGRDTSLQYGSNAYTRIVLGPNSLYGLFYLAPPLFTIGVLIFLLVRSWRQDRRRTRNSIADQRRFQSIPQDDRR